ncbi:hypothetical protein J6590_061776 [Homalodisca vitripennis]|nr:hypothetical protein J6590_061776 [Homalodisca vitripennis]
MKAAQSRSDDTAKNIVARIGFEHDLVTAEANQPSSNPGFHSPTVLLCILLGSGVWLGNHLDPEQWGWKRQSSSNVESPTEEGFYMNDETTDVLLLVQFMSNQEDEEEEENRERKEDEGEQEEIPNDDEDE